MNTPIKKFDHEITVLDNGRLHGDILRKLNQLGKSQRWLEERLGVSRTFLWRISKNKEISISTFFKIAGWLDEDLNKYAIKQKLR